MARAVAAARCAAPCQARPAARRADSLAAAARGARRGTHRRDCHQGAEHEVEWPRQLLLAARCLELALLLAAHPRRELLGPLLRGGALRAQGRGGRAEQRHRAPRRACGAHRPCARRRWGLSLATPRPLAQELLSPPHLIGLGSRAAALWLFRARDHRSNGWPAWRLDGKRASGGRCSAVHANTAEGQHGDGSRTVRRKKAPVCVTGWRLTFETAQSVWLRDVVHRGSALFALTCSDSPPATPGCGWTNTMVMRTLGASCIACTCVYIG